MGKIDHWKLMREPLARETFYALREAQVLVQRRKKEYNRVQPLSVLGYRPPAPEAMEPLAGEQAVQISQWHKERGQVIDS